MIADFNIKAISDTKSAELKEAYAKAIRDHQNTTEISAAARIYTKLILHI